MIRAALLLLLLEYSNTESGRGSSDGALSSASVKMFNVSRRHFRYRARSAKSVVLFLLELGPPLFHLSLLCALTFYAVWLNPDSARWHVTAVFLSAQIIANWGFFLANKAVIRLSPKNFPGYVHRFPSMTEANPTVVDVDAIRAKWKECESCDMHVPVRTHHCPHCKVCILALDHHCYFLGHCVGLTNMRFFVVFCFYAAIGAAVGVYNLVEVMSFYRSLATKEAAFYFMPFTFVMYTVGRAAGFEVVYSGLIDFGLGAVGCCSALFLYGLYSAFAGTTPYERSRRARKKSPLLLRLDDVDEAKGFSLDNFYKVFGECGWLHFLVPVVPFEGPKPESGYRRIITYNHDYIVDGTIYSSEQDLDFSREFDESALERA